MALLESMTSARFLPAQGRHATTTAATISKARGRLKPTSYTASSLWQGSIGNDQLLFRCQAPCIRLHYQARSGRTRRSGAALAVRSVADRGDEVVLDLPGAPGVELYVQDVFNGDLSRPVSSIVRPKSYEALMNHYIMTRRRATQDFVSQDKDLEYWVAPRTYWSLVWPGALVLAQWVMQHGEQVQGKRCLELGAGMGLPGCCAAAQGAARVVLTDGEDHALSSCIATAASNGVLGAVEVRKLDWSRIGGRHSRPSDEGADLKGSFDVVMLAEALYDEALTLPCARTVGALLRAPEHGVSRVLLANRKLPNQKPFTEQFLQHIEAEEGIVVESHVQKMVTIDDNGWCLIDGVMTTQSGFPGDGITDGTNTLEGDSPVGFDMTSTNELMVDMVVLRRA